MEVYADTANLAKGRRVTHKLFVILNFEIVVDQKGGTYEQTFESGPELPMPNIARGVVMPSSGQKY